MSNYKEKLAELEALKVETPQVDPKLLALLKRSVPNETDRTLAFLVQDIEQVAWRGIKLLQGRFKPRLLTNAAEQSFCNSLAEGLIEMIAVNLPIFEEQVDESDLCTSDEKFRWPK